MKEFGPAFLKDLPKTPSQPGGPTYKFDSKKGIKLAQIPLDLKGNEIKPGLRMRTGQKNILLLPKDKWEEKYPKWDYDSFYKSVSS